MTSVYPIYLKYDKNNNYTVRIPDFDQCTEGKDITDAFLMARDAIGQLGIYMEDTGKKIPKPFSVASSVKAGEIMSLIDIDFTSYRKKADTRMVKKNCTIPYYLEKEASEKGINFSKVLTESLKNILASS